MRNGDTDDYVRAIQVAVRDMRRAHGMTRYAACSDALERAGSISVRSLERIAERLHTTPSLLLREAERTLRTGAEGEG